MYTHNNKKKKKEKEKEHYHYINTVIKEMILFYFFKSSQAFPFPWDE